MLRNKEKAFEELRERMAAKRKAPPPERRLTAEDTRAIAAALHRGANVLEHLPATLAPLVAALRRIETLIVNTKPKYHRTRLPKPKLVLPPKPNTIEEPIFDAQAFIQELESLEQK